MSDEIARLIRDHKRMGYSTAAICSMSFDIEDLAAKNLAAEERHMGVQDEQDRSASRRWLTALEEAREAIDALGGAAAEPAVDRDLDQIILIIDHLRSREIERLDPAKAAAVAINPLPAFSTITAVRAALDDLDFRPVKAKAGLGRYLDDCDEATSLSLRFTVEKVDEAWSLYVEPEVETPLYANAGFSTKMIYRRDGMPDREMAIEAAEDFRATMIARILNVPPIKEPDWHLLIKPEGHEGMSGAAKPHIAVWFSKDKAGLPAEKVNSIYLHQRPSASVFELTQEAEKWSEGFRSAMRQVQPSTRIIVHLSPMEWAAGPPESSHLRRTSVASLRSMAFGAENWVEDAQAVRSEIVKLGATEHRGDNLFVCHDRKEDAALRSAVNQAVEAVDRAIGVAERYRETVQEVLVERSPKPQAPEAGPGM